MEPPFLEKSVTPYETESISASVSSSIQISTSTALPLSKQFELVQKLLAKCENIKSKTSMTLKEAILITWIEEADALADQNQEDKIKEKEKRFNEAAHVMSGKKEIGDLPLPPLYKMLAKQEDLLQMPISAILESRHQPIPSTTPAFITTYALLFKDFILPSFKSSSSTFIDDVLEGIQLHMERAIPDEVKGKNKGLKPGYSRVPIKFDLGTMFRGKVQWESPEVAETDKILKAHRPFMRRLVNEVNEIFPLVILAKSEHSVPEDLALALQKLSFFRASALRRCRDTNQRLHESFDPVESEADEVVVPSSGLIEKLSTIRQWIKQGELLQKRLKNQERFTIKQIEELRLQGTAQDQVDKLTAMLKAVRFEQEKTDRSLEIFQTQEELITRLDEEKGRGGPRAQERMKKFGTSIRDHAIHTLEQAGAPIVLKKEPLFKEKKESLKEEVASEFPLIEMFELFTQNMELTVELLFNDLQTELSKRSEFADQDQNATLSSFEVADFCEAINRKSRKKAHHPNTVSVGKVEETSSSEEDSPVDLIKTLSETSSSSDESHVVEESSGTKGEQTTARFEQVALPLGKSLRHVLKHDLAPQFTPDSAFADEAKAHHQQAAIGLHKLFQAASSKHYDSLSAFVPLYILDLSIVIEQLLLPPYVQKHGALPPGHHLIIRAREADVFNQLSKETQRYLAEIANGCVWGRYPEMASQGINGRGLKPLEIIRGALNLSQVDPDGQKERALALVGRCVELYKRHTAAVKELLGLLCTDEQSINRLNTGFDVTIGAMEREFKAIEGIEDEFAMSKPLQEHQVQIDRMLVDMKQWLDHQQPGLNGYSKGVLRFREAMGTLNQIKQTLPLVSDHEPGKNGALLYRSLMRIQLFFEQLYLARAEQLGLGEIMTHDLDVYHKIFEDDETYLPSAFNFVDGIKYSHSSTASTAKKLVKLEKEMDHPEWRVEEGFETPGQTNIALEADRFLTSALPLVEKHLGLFMKTVAK